MNKLLSIVFLLLGFLLFLNFGYSNACVCDFNISNSTITLLPSIDNCTINTNDTDFENLFEYGWEFFLDLNSVDLNAITIIHNYDFDITINLLDENFIGKTINICSEKNNYYLK